MKLTTGHTPTLAVRLVIENGAITSVSIKNKAVCDTCEETVREHSEFEPANGSWESIGIHVLTFVGTCWCGKKHSNSEFTKNA